MRGLEARLSRLERGQAKPELTIDPNDLPSNFDLATLPRKPDGTLDVANCGQAELEALMVAVRAARARAQG